MSHQKFGVMSLLTFCLSGCVTLSGTYVISASDAEGREVATNVHMMAEGSGIYSARNAICATNPGAIVRIRDAKTGNELQSESPYRCPIKYPASALVEKWDCKAHPYSNACVS